MSVCACANVCVGVSHETGRAHGIGQWRSNSLNSDSNINVSTNSTYSSFPINIHIISNSNNNVDLNI